jgi:t-SNARE complex subunit (syntaxin)
MYKEVLDLKQSMDILHEIVKSHQPMIDSIEIFIEESKKEVKESKKEIESISNYQSNWIYYIGTIVFIYFIII